VQGQENMRDRLHEELGWDAVIPKSNQVFEV
jgi:hypothetical protein